MHQATLFSAAVPMGSPVWLGYGFPCSIPNMYSLLGAPFQDRVDSMKSTPTAANRKDEKPKQKTLFRPWLTEPDTKNVEKVHTCQQQDYSKHHSPAEPKDPIAKPNESQMNFELLATNLGKSRDGYQCIYCGKLYSRKYGLKIHLRTHTGFRPLKCQVCNRAFGDPSNLNKHTRLHADAAARFHKCPRCGKLLIRRRDLERHLQTRHHESV